ncbi:MAG: hypothetical protein M1825_003362 [Sarcosagium campestre]|nr:MAG: hypothetical protein M1825_003362 [Sarcosagium campestre]
MPSKKAKGMSHSEIWDDSALIESWDEALEEYKHYHSIQARGEKIEDVLHQAALQESSPQSSRGRKEDTKGTQLNGADSEKDKHLTLPFTDEAGLGETGRQRTPDAGDVSRADVQHATSQGMEGFPAELIGRGQEQIFFSETTGFDKAC